MAPDKESSGHTEETETTPPMTIIEALRIGVMILIIGLPLLFLYAGVVTVHHDNKEREYLKERREKKERP